MNRIHAILCCFYFLIGGEVLAIDPPPHTNLLGVYGGVINPGARFGEDRQAFVSVNYMPYEKRIVVSNWEEGRPERLIHFNLMFLDFMSVSAHLVQPLNKEKPWGIGDRSFKFRFKLLEESRHLPAIALGIHDPISSRTFQGSLYLVGNKTFGIATNTSLDAHLGYGYNIQNQNQLTQFVWGEKPERRSSQTIGMFGGFSLNYTYHSLLFEYDTRDFNLGYSFAFLHQYNTPWSLRIGVYALELRYLSAQLAVFYRFGDRIFEKRAW